jgi:hypothetical protein
MRPEGSRGPAGSPEVRKTFPVIGNFPRSRLYPRWTGVVRAADASLPARGERNPRSLCMPDVNARRYAASMAPEEATAGSAGFEPINRDVRLAR